jgi:hypothetical protein
VIDPPHRLDDWYHTDIGGYGIGAGARDVHEEGLSIRR